MFLILIDAFIDDHLVRNKIHIVVQLTSAHMHAFLQAALFLCISQHALWMELHSKPLVFIHITAQQKENPGLLMQPLECILFISVTSFICSFPQRRREKKLEKLNF